jgi:CrcB protein
MTAVLWSAMVMVGGLGSVCRFGLDRAVAARMARAFPFGTLAVNLSGATLLGAITGLALSPTGALLAGTAFVGAYTTFSTWMLETQRLAEERLIGAAAVNVAVSVLLGICAAAIGQWIGARL